MNMIIILLFWMCSLELCGDYEDLHSARTPNGELWRFGLIEKSVHRIVDLEAKRILGSQNVIPAFFAGQMRSIHATTQMVSPRSLHKLLNRAHLDAFDQCNPWPHLELTVNPDQVLSSWVSRWLQYSQRLCSPLKTSLSAFIYDDLLERSTMMPAQ